MQYNNSNRLVYTFYCRAMSFSFLIPDILVKILNFTLRDLNKEPRRAVSNNSSFSIHPHRMHSLWIYKGGLKPDDDQTGDGL
ncbi:hypothetical protein DdX_08538 [Ditylenchus destructor]|uniref:Uncharacterized protein n=1 Tax=Ditylenchus destructor TaxID=166010 RepID=A0AAD4N2K5_9BILA|nr:hypothetical protein DdX_08538 [Ditylenchus destructor]